MPMRKVQKITRKITSTKEENPKREIGTRLQRQRLYIGQRDPDKAGQPDIDEVTARRRETILAEVKENASSRGQAKSEALSNVQKKPVKRKKKHDTTKNIIAQGPDSRTIATK